MNGSSKTNPWNQWFTKDGITPGGFAFIVGLLLVGLGLLLGLVVSPNVSGAQGSIPAGAPWIGESEELSTAALNTTVSNLRVLKGLSSYGDTDYASLGTEARQDRGMIAFVVLGLGVICVGASFVKRPGKAVDST